MIFNVLKFKVLIRKILLFSLSIIVGIIIFNNCSTSKNTMPSRTYHNLTSHYNVYFNGKEAMKSGVKKIDQSFDDNYAAILSMFKYGDESIARNVFPDMDKAIKKASKLIKIHSITAKPKRKKGKSTKKRREFYNKKEYNAWVDDAYLLMGKAHFYKHDFYSGIESFNYLVKEYSEEEIKYDALLWLARSYNEMEKYEEAREILNLLEGDRKFPKNLEGELFSIFADYYLKQENYQDAIPKLKKTIENTRKKTLKIRYTFILGQIYEELEIFKRASEQYKIVIDKNIEYELTFNAKIRLATSYDGGGSGKELLKDLNKMLKDDKNIEYQDQIYYALGNIAFKQEKYKEAVELYKMSAWKSVGNYDQMSMSYLATADIYFFIPNYKKAQVYYDSCVSFLSEEYQDYDLISKKSKNLNKLVENINIVELEDSLQYVANLPESERNGLIDKIIEKVKEEEKKLKELQRQQQMNTQLFKQNQRDPRNRNITGSGWYFYNPTAMSFGQTEFSRLWGKRKLEDNWRRANKSIVSFEDEFADSEEGEGEDGEGKKKKIDNKSREYYMRGLPLNDSLITISDTKIMEAMFKIGEIYKDDFSDYGLSIGAFKNLNSRFPENLYLLATFYNLYKLELLLNENENAAKYKNIIITDYPDSKYAQMLTNPNYLKEMSEKEKQVDYLYTETYNDFLSKNYVKVISNSTKAETEYSESTLMPKFLFVKALSIGETQDKESFKTSLEYLISKFPKSEVAEPANNILTIMNDGNSEFSENENTFSNSSETVENEKPTNEEEIYNFDEKSDHYYICIIDNSVVDVNRLKFNISNFNIDFFSMIELNVKSVILDGNLEMITVKSLKNKKNVMSYFKTIDQNTDVFKDMNKSNVRHFVLSSENFPVFYKDKDISKYLKYFSKHYYE